MRRHFRRRPSPALVIAMIALFVALGGVSYGLAGKSTVFSDDIVNGSVKSKDVRNGNLKGKDVKNNSLTGSDVFEPSLGPVPDAESATNADTADDADRLGGVGPNGYQTTADLLFGAADTAGGSFAVVPERSRGVTGGERVGQGFYEVDFSRDVSDCTWLATAGNTGIGTSAWIATTRAPRAGQPNTEVGIVVFDAAGAQVDPSSIFVQVLCP